MLEPTAIQFAIAGAGVLVISLIVSMIRHSLGHISDSSRRYAAKKIVSFAGYFVGLIFAAVVFQNALGNLAVVLGAAAAGIAFALKEVLVSLAGWVGITFGDYFKIGDRIQMSGITGDVVDIGFTRTTLMELGEWVKSDLYTGRIVRVSNSAVLTAPLFNYSADFPFLWDEITVPVRYGSDCQLATEKLRLCLDEITSGYARDAESYWERLSRKYLVKATGTIGVVTLVLNDNWMEFTLRYVVDLRERRSVKDKIFRRILDEFDKSEGKLSFASATLQLLKTPVIDVRVAPP